MKTDIRFGSFSPARLLAMIALVLTLTARAQSTVITNLDPGALAAAMQAGGTVTFATNGTIVLTNTITVSNTVTLDGTSAAITISGGGAVQIFNVPASGNLTLRRLTIANAVNVATEGPYQLPVDSQGGAIFTAGALQIADCTFTNDSAAGETTIPLESPGVSCSGGAVYNSGTLTVTNSLFVNNSATGGSGSGFQSGTGGGGYGGAIYNNGGNVGLGNVTFLQNSVGGGVGTRASSASISGSAFGGAIYSTGGTVGADGLQFLNNRAAGSSPGYGGTTGTSTGGAGYGGGIYVAGGILNVSNSVFSNNVAQGGISAGSVSGPGSGAGVYNAGAAVCYNCAFAGNSAYGANGGVVGGNSSASSSAGGAIVNLGMLQIINSSIDNNSATGGTQSSPLSTNQGSGLGGAIYNTGSVVLDATTLTSNFAVGATISPYTHVGGSGLGGAIDNLGFVQFSNSTLSNNYCSGQITNGETIYNTGIIQSDTNSVLAPAAAGTSPFTYQWQWYGTNIPSATNADFNLGNVQFGVAGTYSVITTDSNGVVANLSEIVNQLPTPIAISSVNPDVGPVGGGTTLSIFGAGFSNSISVYFGNTQAEVTFVNSSNITVQTPGASSVGAVNVLLSNGVTSIAVLTNGFTYVAAGSLQVFLGPDGAVSAGAQWQIDGGNWLDSGEIATNLAVGNHSITFQALTNWTAPAPETISITSNTTTTINGTYVEHVGAVTVTIYPDAAAAAGAQWQLDGGGNEPSGATVTNIPAGAHTISFTSLTGWQAPPSETITIVNGVLLATSGTYAGFYGSSNGVVFITNGDGTIKTPKNPVVGKTYTVTAVPKPKNVFVSWVGGTAPPYTVMSTSANFTFTDEPNLVVEADFATNVFFELAGTYRGLFAPDDSREQTNSGSFVFSVTSTGVLSGSLDLAGRAVSVSGKLGSDGTATIVSKRTPGEPSLTTTLQFDAADQTVSGSVTDGTFTTALNGNKDVFTRTANAAAYAGQYTLIIPGVGDPATGPYGASYATVKIDSLGRITMAGVLGDGTAFSQSSVVSQNGMWPMYASLYNGNGSLWGWNYIAGGQISSATPLSWINATNTSKTANYRTGFTNAAATLIGGKYSPATSLPQPFQNEALVTLAGGDLRSEIADTVTISSGKKIVITGSSGETNKLTLTIATSTGLITGSFVNPANVKETIKLNGVVLGVSVHTNGVGHFLGTNQSGSFTLSPQ